MCGTSTGMGRRKPSTSTSAYCAENLPMSPAMHQYLRRPSPRCAATDTASIHRRRRRPYPRQTSPMIGPQMRKRIVTLAVLAATLATSLFGIPLAIAAAQLFLSQEATELEHTADIAALDVSADLIHARQPGQLLTSAATTSLALYGPDGRLVVWRGAALARPGAARTRV